MMNEAYTKALARADKLGVKIMGRGRWTDGKALFLVSSASAPAQARIVTVDGAHQTCNCPSRQLCTHVAVVRRELERQANEIDAHISRYTIADAREEQARAAAAKRDTSSVYRSNAPVSIWASA